MSQIKPITAILLFALPLLGTGCRREIHETEIADPLIKEWTEDDNLTEKRYADLQKINQQRLREITEYDQIFKLSEGDQDDFRRSYQTYLSGLVQILAPSIELEWLEPSTVQNEPMLYEFSVVMRNSALQVKYDFSLSTATYQNPPTLSSDKPAALGNHMNFFLDEPLSEAVIARLTELPQEFFRKSLLQESKAFGRSFAEFQQKLNLQLEQGGIYLQDNRVDGSLPLEKRRVQLRLIPSETEGYHAGKVEIIGIDPELLAFKSQGGGLFRECNAVKCPIDLLFRFWKGWLVLYRVDPPKDKTLQTYAIGETVIFAEDIWEHNVNLPYNSRF